MSLCMKEILEPRTLDYEIPSMMVCEYIGGLPNCVVVDPAGLKSSGLPVHFDSSTVFDNDMQDMVSTSLRCTQVLYRTRVKLSLESFM